jgi:type IV secretory pathway TraG/TraD family ATPase VirD4
VWLVIDELKSVGQLPSLPGILDKGRKYKTSVVLGFQAISQLKKIYGDADATSILQGLQNQFYFRMTEPSCSEYVSRMIGSEDVEQASFGVSFGAESKQDRGSLNQTRKERSLVMPEEVRALETLHAFAKICHHHPVKLRFEITERKRLQNAFVPRVRGAKRESETPTQSPDLVPETAQFLREKESVTLDDFLG